MKLFVSPNKKKEYISGKSYHWTDPDEILMPKLFRDSRNLISLVGIKTLKSTTQAVVKNVEIKREFLYELLKESIERSMKCQIGDDGKYQVTVGWSFDLDLNKQVDELISIANPFHVGDTIIIRRLKIK